LYLENDYGERNFSANVTSALASTKNEGIERIEYSRATVIVKKKIVKKQDRGVYLVIHLSCMSDLS